MGANERSDPVADGSPGRELRGYRGRFWSTAVAIAVAIAVGAVGWFGLRKVGEASRKAIADQLQGSLNASRTILLEWLSDRPELAARWAADPEVEQAVSDLLANYPALESSRDALLRSPELARLRRRLDPLAKLSEHVGFVVFDPSGFQVGAFLDDAVGKRFIITRSDFVNRALEGGTVVSAPFTAGIDLPDHDGVMRPNQPTMFAAAPIRNDRDEIIAVLGLRLHTSKHFSRLIEASRVGESGETYAFDASGLMISDSRFNDELRQAGILDPAQDSRAMLTVELRDPGGNMIEGYRPTLARGEQPFTRMAASALAGQSGIDVTGYRDYRGVPVVGAWAWLPTYRLGIATEADASEAYATYNLQRNVFFSLFGLLIGAALLSLVLQARQNRIEAARRKAEAELRALNESMQKENWLKTEIARLSGMMQGVRDQRTLLQSVISELAPLVEAGHGAFYVVEQGDGEPAQGALALLGTYAYTERKNVSKRFKFGEGLVGQCAVDKTPILLTQVPPDYVRVSSGLGGGVPLNIRVSPVLFEDQVVGVMELASFHVYTEVQRELLDQVAANVGVAIKSVQERQRTAAALAESRRLGEELQAQSEELQVQSVELRTINEELESQSEELKQSEEELQAQAEELQVTNEELEKKTGILERQKIEVEQTNVDLERARRETEEKGGQLAQASRYKSEFLANMSHELRTPLNSLLILAHLLAGNKDGNLTEKQVEWAHVICSSGQDLADLINDVLDLSKVEAGKSEARIEKVEIAGLLDSLKQQFDPVASEQDLTFELEIADDVPAVLAIDRQHTEQILKNLLSNACKFTDAGSVTLRIHRPEPGVRFAHTALTPDSAIALSVIDTGIGIPAAKQSEIFDAFQQANGSTNRDFGGTGLGLTISRALAKLLDGEIQLQSREGQGSTFTLYLPLESACRPEVESSQAPAQDVPVVVPAPEAAPADGSEQSLHDSYQMLRGRKILLVDDDRRSADALSVALGMHGLDVHTAGSSKLALQKLQSEPDIDLVLMDIMMPIMDGYEVIRRIRKQPRYRDLPIIALTAKAMPEDRRKCLQAGANNYMSKPVRVEEILSLIRVWLSGR